MTWFYLEARTGYLLQFCSQNCVTGMIFFFWGGGALRPVSLVSHFKNSKFLGLKVEVKVCAQCIVKSWRPEVKLQH